MVWPDLGPSSRLEKDPTYGAKSRPSQNSKGFATQGTQTSPDFAGQGSQQTSQPAIGAQSAPQQPRKPRRPLAKQYAIAARERRLRQEYNNHHRPPKEEDIWICQFCEYESIFGQPPQHLIRQYEAKDRRERRRLAEKRRLLEKAKMKGRKVKKGNKNSNKNANTGNQSNQQAQKQHSDQPAVNDQLQISGTQSEDHVLDGYDEENNQATGSTLSQTPSKIPQPVKQTQVHSLRPPSGSGNTTRGSSAIHDTYF